MSKLAKEKIQNRNNVLKMLFTLYLLTRLVNLTLLPIFNDEATYIDWGYRMINQKGHAFHSVLHAKPPFLMWIFGFSQKIFSNPLVAGRLVSVITGLLSLFGIYSLSKFIFNEKTAYYASFLYIVNPIFTFYDRQALMESAIAAVGIWSFYFLSKAIKEKGSKNFLWLGAVLGFGYFIKSNTFVFFLSTVVISFILLIKLKEEKEKLFNGLFSTLGVSLLVLSPLIFQQSFWTSLEQNQKYILTPTKLLSFPLSAWLKNIYEIVHIILVYINPLILIPAAISLCGIIKNRKPLPKLFSVWMFSCLGFTAVFGKTISVRYLVSFLPILLIFAAYFFASQKRKVVSNLIFIFILPSIIITILLIIKPLTYFDILDSFTKHSQKTHYVTHWSSGYGFEDTRKYLLNETKNQRIIVGVRVDAGIPENAVFTYFNSSKQVFPTYLDTEILQDLSEYDCLVSSRPIYFVSRDGNLAGLGRFFEEIQKFTKPEGESFIGVHKLKSPCEGKSIKLF